MKLFLAVLVLFATALSAGEVVVLHHGDPIPKDGVVCQFENEAVQQEFARRIAAGEVATKEVAKEEPKSAEKTEKPSEEAEKPVPVIVEEKKADPAPKEEKKVVYKTNENGVVIIHKGDPLPPPGFTYSFADDEAEKEVLEKAVARIIVPKSYRSYRIQLDASEFNINACKSG